jgi:hypothetical protein
MGSTIVSRVALLLVAACMALLSSMPAVVDAKYCLLMISHSVNSKSTTRQVETPHEIDVELTVTMSLLGAALRPNRAIVADRLDTLGFPTVVKTVTDCMDQFGGFMKEATLVIVYHHKVDERQFRNSLALALFDKYKGAPKGKVMFYTCNSAEGIDRMSDGPPLPLLIAGLS